MLTKKHNESIMNFKEPVAATDAAKKARLVITSSAATVILFSNDMVR
jgi:hypothetical protein